MGKSKRHSISQLYLYFAIIISYDLADANQVLLRLGYSGETQTQGWNIGASYHTGGDTDGADITAQYHWKF